MAIKLQIPTIVNLKGSTLEIAHPDLSLYPKQSIAGTFAAGGTTLQVVDNEGFADTDMILLGPPGASDSEAVAVNGAVTRGQSITIANTTKFGHAESLPVTLLKETSVKIYGANTLTDIPVLIATTPIQWSQPSTFYSSADTSYNYYVVAFTSGSVDSDFSERVPVAGLGENTAIRVIERALKATQTDLDSTITIPMLLEGLTSAQEYYQNYVNERGVRHNWSFEEITDSSTLITQELEASYDLGLLPFKLKYPNSIQGVPALWLGNQPMFLRDLQFVEQQYAYVNQTVLTAQANPGDVVLNVETTANFPDNGTIRIGTDVLTYTAKTATSFTGIPATGSGSLQNTYAIDRSVWANLKGMAPRFASIKNNMLILDNPPGPNYAGKAIKISVYKKFEPITYPTQELEVPFDGTLVEYLCYRIKLSKENIGLAKEHQNEFEKRVSQESKGDKSHPPDPYTYQEMNDSDPRDYYLGGVYADR